MACPNAQTLNAGNSPARESGPRPRGEKLHESPANFTRCPEASPGPRWPGTLRRPHSPGQCRPGSARRARAPLGAWGALGVCGAAPLPSPPGGGPAGWGARARRTGFSCGPWGPWRAWWPVGLGGAWLRVRGDAPGWARPCRSGRRGDSRLTGKWRGGGLCAHG